MPEVSFLLPVHNGARYLSETLESVLSQDHGDFDVLVVDDGSTDSTPKIVEQLGSHRVRYLAKAHGGLVDALNHGLLHMDCTFVARIDADDICFPQRISSQLDFLTFTGAVAVSSRSLHIDTAGHVLGLSAEHPLFDADPRFLPAKEPYLPHPFLLARLDALQELGYRHAHLAEDADLCWRLAERWPIALQRAVLGKYRLHETSVSARSLASARVQAFFSQLAALNTVRRGDGRKELPYRVSMTAALTAGAQGWDALMALYDADLTGDEATWLHNAALLKLFELASWRNFEPSVADIMTAGQVVRDIVDLGGTNLENARTLLESVCAPGEGAPAQDHPPLHLAIMDPAAAHPDLRHPTP
ncbi:MAG: glycosyltransferase family 2 protein [Pseudomonadota bacterium]